MRLTAVVDGTERHVTIPAHDPLKVGTVSGILNDVAVQLRKSRREIELDLFG